MTTESFEVYWNDLTPEAQERFRETMTTDPDDSNWDTFPITTYETEVDIIRYAEKFKEPKMRSWVCKTPWCGHEVLSQILPQPIDWTDGHICHFREGVTL